MRLDDKDILTDCLSESKFYSQGYHLAALEAASDQVRNTFLRMMNDELANAKMIFDAMHQRGWYPVDMARPAAATAAYTPYAAGAGVRPDITTPGMQPGFQPRPEAGYALRPEANPPQRW